MAFQKLLLPYHFTHLDQKALDFVINTFGKQDNITVTVFNAYTPLPDIETSADSVTGKLKGSLTYLAQKIKENEGLLDGVKNQLVEGGFPENRVDCIYRPRKKDIASEITDLVSSDKFDIIIVATTADYFLITFDRIKLVMEEKKKGTLILDISDPRAVDEGITSLPGIKLLFRDQVSEIYEENAKLRSDIVPAVEKIISKEIPILSATMKRT